MSQDPSPYDLLQDNQISALQDIVTPYYTPPGDVEYSFPVVGQGINADQYQLMSLTQGDGIIHRGRNPYILRKHDSDAETNTRNTLILGVDRNTGHGESVIGGFYHRLYDDMELSFPPVTTPTDYYVCLTRDPRNEESPTGPISVQIYAGSPPTTHGRQHVVLNVVRREPNQLLSEATIQRYRQFVSPTISVQYVEQLPPASDVLFGTVAFVGVAGSPSFELYTTSGSGWRNMLKGDWNTVNPLGSWGNPFMWRYEMGGVRLSGSISRNGETYNQRVTNFPFRPQEVFAWSIGSNQAGFTRARIDTNGDFFITDGPTGNNAYFYVNNVFIPLD